MLERLTGLICENKPAKPTSKPAKPVEYFVVLLMQMLVMYPLMYK